MTEANNTLTKTRILVVEDHPAVREALAMRVAQTPDMEICGEAVDVVEALRLCADLHPDLIIVDLTLKNSDGIEFIKRLKAHNEKAHILVWSMHSETVYAERALRAGAMGYITKEHATDKIIDALRQVLAGKIYLSPALKERLLSRMTSGVRGTGDSPVDTLTDRELQVFRLIGQGVKTHDIADRLHLSVKTVETHRDRIKKKLELQDAIDLIRTATLWVAENA